MDNMLTSQEMSGDVKPGHVRVLVSFDGNWMGGEYSLKLLSRSVAHSRSTGMAHLHSLMQAIRSNGSIHEHLQHADREVGCALLHSTVIAAYCEFRQTQRHDPTMMSKFRQILRDHGYACVSAEFVNRPLHDGYDAEFAVGFIDQEVH